MRSRVRLLVSVAVVALISLGVLAPLAAAQSEEPDAGDTLEIFMVTFRGCEEACQGFLDYIASIRVDANITVRDADRDRGRLPDFVAEVNRVKPDLLVTWGTSVTLGMIGTIDGSTEAVVDDIPTVFMIVADPLGAGIVESYEHSGRALVAGTRNRVPEETQMRALADYRAFDRLGVIYNDNELNAVLKAEELRQVGAAQGFEVIERVLQNDDDGEPLVDDIPRAIADIASEEVDFLYVGSNSFILANADLFTTTALEHGLAVATAYEAMVRDSHALIALASAYYNVGQLAGFQAERILADGQRPGDLEVLGLDRFSVLINIETAKTLERYPPMLLMRYAEIVGGQG